MINWNLDKLYEILRETTSQYRKGPEMEESNVGNVGVVEIYMMPHESEIPQGSEIVDMHFVSVAIDKEAAEKRRDDLVEILDAYPDPDRIAGGPSYIEVGGMIGDQGAAFQLFALGKALKLWDVITPERVGMEGQNAREMAGMGFIMITGYHKGGKTVEPADG